MGSALAQAIRKSQPDTMILLADKEPNKVQDLMGRLGQPCRVWKSDSITSSETTPEVILWGVKPHNLAEAIHSYILPPLLERQPLLISMAVATSLKQLESYIEGKWIRIMPNTPVTTGKGLIAYQANNLVQADELETFREIFAGGGRLLELEEHLFDAFSAIAGSGPAFVMMMIEAISDAGVYCGLPRQMALEIASETLAGSAEWMLASDQHPGFLKDQVTSPAGTTIAGVRQLEASGLRSSLIEAILATYQRAHELSGRK